MKSDLCDVLALDNVYSGFEYKWSVRCLVPDELSLPSVVHGGVLKAHGEKRPSILKAK